MRENHVVTNQAVLNALGITQKRVVSCEIKLRLNEAPLVVLGVHAGESMDGVETRRFRLVLDDEDAAGAQKGAPDGTN